MSKPVSKPPTKRQREMAEAVAAFTKEGELHRQVVTAVDQVGGFQAPATAIAPPVPAPPVPPARPAPQAPQVASVEAPNNEAPALIFDLPTKRRKGKHQDPNYRATSVRIHRMLWDWAQQVKLKDGWDLADLINLALAVQQKEWDETILKAVVGPKEAEQFEAKARELGMVAEVYLAKLVKDAIEK